MTVDDLLALEEIRNLRHGYAAHLDAQDLDALVELFTEDATCEFGHYGTWAGRETIRNNYAAVIQALGRPFDAMHVVTNPWVRLTGPDTARGRWYLIDLLPIQHPETGFASRGGHDNPLLYLGIYEDDYRKVGGRWKIAAVKLHFLWPQHAFEGLRHPR